MRNLSLLSSVVLLLALAAYVLYPRKHLVAYLLLGVLLVLVAALALLAAGIL